MASGDIFIALILFPIIKYSIKEDTWNFLYGEFQKLKRFIFNMTFCLVPKYVLILCKLVNFRIYLKQEKVVTKLECDGDFGVAKYHHLLSYLLGHHFFLLNYNQFCLF